MKRIAVPLAIGVLLLVVYGALALLWPDVLGDEAWKWLLAALLAGFMVAFVRVISFLLFDLLFQRRKGREAPALLRGVLSIILYAISMLLIYKLVLQKPLGGFEFVATSTVVSVIIGLAMQDTLGNFFAGLSIHTEQPFHILDSIRIGDMLGRVEAVTWRTTTIRTNNNTTVIFPNSKVARETLEVYRFNGLNRHVLLVPAPYQAPPQKVITLLQETVAAIRNVASEKTPIVRIGSYADSNIVYEVLYWVKDYMLVPDIDSQIRQHLWYLYARNQMEIPFPVRHVVVEQREPRVEGAKPDYASVIQSVEIFEPLSPDEKAVVAGSAIRSSYAPGEMILRRGSFGDSMFIVYNGSVEVRLSSGDGNAQQVAQLERGNFFGEMALLTGEPRNADIIALTEVETLEITKSVLQQLLDENAALAEALSNKIAERQTKLDEYARFVPDERQIQSRAILRRIKHFFGLD